MWEELRFSPDDWQCFTDNARIIGYKVFGRKTASEGLFQFTEYIFMGGCPLHIAKRLKKLNRLQSSENCKKSRQIKTTLKPTLLMR